MRSQNYLYLSSEAEGGLARYGLQQASAIAAKLPESDLFWLGSKTIEVPEGAVRIDGVPSHAATLKKKSTLGRAIAYWKYATDPIKALDLAIEKHRPQCVLLNSWSEYFAPFWAWRLRRWRKKGVRFGAVIHDPVRDFVRGPLWWHRWSIRQAYSFLEIAFVHDDTPLDMAGAKQTIKRVQIPHGPYPTPVPKNHASREQLRADWGIPEDGYLLLAFGHIRDGKNLHLLLEALQKHSSAYLLVAGNQQSSGQKSVKDYQDIAAKLGVADRCRWVNTYIPEEEVWKYFTACDAVTLTYSTDFRSASGVLNVNVQFQKPVIASCGPSPLKTAVTDYNLGPWVKPDSTSEIDRGLAALLKSPEWPEAQWDKYAKDNSWEENARRVIETFEALN